MIRKISVILLLCCTAIAVFAQQTASAASQQTLSAKDMIAISPMVPYSIDLPEDAQKSLGIKLGQMVTQNGFGGYSGQFVLTANVVMIDKQATATAPVQFMTKLEVSVYLVDVMEQVVMGEMSYEVTGVDRLENKAVIQAINQIVPKSTKSQEFMNGCREKIVAYYNTRIPAMMTEAHSMASRNDYNGALELLSAVPSSVADYPKVAALMSQVYIKKIDREAEAAITAAKGKVAVKDYEGALAALEGVDPASTKAPQALTVISQIRSSISATANAGMTQKLQVYEDSRRDHDDAVMLEKMRIDAAKTVGVAMAEGNTSLASRVNKWFTGKFK